MNIGAIWGLILAAIFIFVMIKKFKKKAEKEVKVINVARPKETTTRTEPKTGRTKPRVDKRAGGKKFKGKSAKRRRVQTKSSSTDNRNKKRTESDSPAIIPVEPFEG